MYIEPNSIVKILHGVPLDNKYEHTLCWDHYGNNAKTAQINFFDNADRIKYTLTKQTYQRYDRGYIKVAIPVDNLYDCDYMMFQNTSYGNKWFYAFITNVSYVNGNNQTGTTLIEYEIDRMQTWYFDYELMQCFVEREHSATDEVGDNIVDEGLNTGDYYYTKLYEKNFNDFYLLITYIPNENKYVYVKRELGIITEQFSVKQMTFSSLTYTTAPIYSAYNDGGITKYIEAGLKIALPLNNITTLFDPVEGIGELGQALSKANCNIVSLKLVPSEMISAYLVEKYFLYSANAETEISQPEYVNLPIKVENVTIGRNATFNDYSNNTYTPKNNKLYTSPYYGAEIRSTQNDTVELDYKFGNNFKNGTLSFELLYNIYPDTSITLVPTNFNGAPEAFNFSISLNKFPVFSYSEDSYAQWLSAHREAMALRLVGTGINTIGMIASKFVGVKAGLVGQGIVGGASGSEKVFQVGSQDYLSANRAIDSGKLSVGSSAVSGLSAIVKNIFNTLGDISIAKNTRDSYTNDQSAPNLSYVASSTAFYINQMTISPQHAKIIDSYFTRFGYATKITKVPNRNVRTHFCYTKTVGCEIKGKIPQSEREVICNVYDHGITFWKYAADIGNYDVDNPPV